MPAPKIKATASNGSTAAPKPKGGRSTNGTSTPVPPAEEQEAGATASANGSGGKPDKAVYDTEQEKLKKDIEAVNVKLSTLKQKISLATQGGGSGNDRRTTLRAELDSLREQQSGNSNSRGKILEQLKALQEGIQKKIKDLQASKGKIPFKNVAEVDAQIKALDKQVESGNMTLAGEKRALADISTYKRNRRVVETFEANQAAIDADRQTADELKKQLDDPESKAVSERYDTIKAELDELKKESDEAFAGRSKLFTERDGLQDQLNSLYSAKRDSASQFRESNDRYWAKVNEDRARRAEKMREQRQAEEADKKLEIAERLREEAAAPAYQAQIEDCQTLIDYFAGKNSGNTFASSAPSTLFPRKDVAGVEKLALRQVEADQQGLVARKKKGEDEESYFAGKGKKQKKGGAKAAGSTESPATPSSTKFSVPLPTLTALLSLSIPPPANSTDVPRIVEDLKTKKIWFEANQSRATAENIAKAEADIKRLTGATKTNGIAAITTPNGGGEQPAEPAPTPKVSDVPVTAVPSSEVVEKLEEVKEQASTKA